MINYHSVDSDEAGKFDYYCMQRTDCLSLDFAVGNRWKNPSNSENY